MPYLIISSSYPIETSRTTVGDTDINPELLDYLAAGTIKSRTYQTNYIAREVLDRLDCRGYRVVAMAVGPERIYWTLYKPEEP
ncbi:GTP cyclohydrolase 1 feedback regulatory protein-like [Centruroides sculpturatus]|uniref:GTP cyclohydrolase 1 feedback regulatory protein-like n=1 Tax=Centruroides sculpturatus TaxID=218467 RepID=UPI000C6D20E6|nr:GTP cyclohydrolase 1 feedback regulatory protein-like [Centruroides sculpturatus]